MVARACVLLLCAGDTRTQSSDIKRAFISQRLPPKEIMKRRASISHDEATIRELRKSP